MLLTDEPLPCSTDPDLFVAKGKKQLEAARKICRDCVHRLACLEDALEVERLMGKRLTHIRAGTTPAQRENITLQRTA